MEQVPRSDVDPLSLFPQEEATRLEEDVAPYGVLVTPQKSSTALHRGTASVSPPLKEHQPVVENDAMSGRLHKRAWDTLAQLERNAAALEAQKKRFESGMAEISRITDLVSALETRIAKLAEEDQPLASGEVMAARLQQRAVDTLDQLQRTAVAFDAQKTRIDSSVVEVTRLGDSASALEARIAKLTAKDQPLAVGDAMAAGLQQRVVDTTAQLERNATTFDTQKNRFESGMAEVDRLSDLISTLETRIGKLTEKDQPLAAGEAMASGLQQRAVDTMAQLERTAAAFEEQIHRFESGMSEVSRIGDRASALEARIAKLIERDQPLAVGEAMAAGLQQRAVDTTAQLERNAAALEAQKKRFESGMAEISGITDLLSALDVRIANLRQKDQPLALGEAMAFRLQAESAETTRQLERTATTIKAQKNVMESGLTEAARLAQLVSGLEHRIANLTTEDHLGRATALVAQLEQRAVRTTAKLEHVARSTGKLGDELALLQKAVRTVSESARRHVDQLADQNDKGRYINSLRALKPRVWPGGTHVVWSRRVLLGGLIALVAVGGIGTLLLREPGRMSGAALSDQGLAGASSPILPSRASHFSMSAKGLPTVTSTMTATQRSVDSRFAGTPIRLPELTAPVAPEPTQPTTFMGSLSVESNPTGATVFIDRQYAGETPLQLGQLRAGSHVIWIQREGYERWTAAVSVAANKQTDVSANLRR